MKTQSIKNVNLVGRLVTLKKKVLPDGADAADWLFRCEGGFGCDPACIGRKVFGTFVRTGERELIMRDWVDGVVEEEVADEDHQ